MLHLVHMKYSILQITVNVETSGSSKLKLQLKIGELFCGANISINSVVMHISRTRYQTLTKPSLIKKSSICNMQ